MLGAAIPPLPVAVPLLAAAALAAGGKRCPRRLADAVAILVACAVTAMCAWLTIASTHDPIVYWFGGWTPRGSVALGVAFAIDPIGAGLATLSSVLVLAALVFSVRWFDAIGSLFHGLMLAFLAALCGFGLTGDLFNLFVFFELMSAAAFALCGYKSDEEGPLQGALNFAVTNTVAAFLVLDGIALLYARTSALNLAQIARALGGQHDALVVIAFALIACGFLVKAAAVPFHFWLPDAHAVAPTPVSVVFSGVMVTAGVYAVARLSVTVFGGTIAAHGDHARAILLALATATAVVGAALAFAQRHLKRMLAFSTVSHVGVMLLGVALLTSRGFAGASIYALGHGLTKSALFLTAGMMLHRFRTVDELRLRGQDGGIESALFAIGGLGLAGVPPFGTATGASTIGEEATHLGYAWVPWVVALAGAVTGAAVLRASARAGLGWGPPEEDVPNAGGETSETPETTMPRALPWSMVAPACALIALAIAVGVTPRARDVVEACAARMVDAGAYVGRVLDGKAAPLPALASSPAPSFTHEILTGVAALAIAAASILRRAFPRVVRAATRAVIDRVYGVLRPAHSGHVGDYVAWLTLGVAGVGAASLLLLR